MALLHDIGETLSPVNHGEVAASVLRPYISPCNFWILQHHEIFQLVGVVAVAMTVTMAVTMAVAVGGGR